MSHSQIPVDESSSNPGPGSRKSGIDARLFIGPAVVVTLLMAILAAMYLGGVLNPQQNLRSLPMGVVNLDRGATLTTPSGDTPLFLGDQVQQGLLDGVPRDKVDLQRMTLAQAHETADRGRIYGFIVINEDFSEQMIQLAKATYADIEAKRPKITVQVNARAGAYGGNVAVAVATEALDQANVKVGKVLSEKVSETSNGAVLTGTSKLLLQHPIGVSTERYKSEVDGTGGGLSAFYYALLLLLAGFTGSLIINSLTDSMLGFIPTEIGPLYIERERSSLTRLQTLLVKWAIMVLVAVVVSGVYLGIGAWLGMPIEHPWSLYFYGVFAIAATGLACLAILSVLGTLGLLVNLIVFVVLGLPTSGATIPVEAIPSSFVFLSHFEPLHAVYLGARAILYFDAIGNAGLYDALWKTGLGIVVALVVASGAWIYDRKGYTRGQVTVVQ